MASASTPHIGHGVGLRPKHYPRLLEGPVDVDWLEIITENYLVGGGRPLHVLDRLRSQVPVVMHGVSLCLGSVQPLDMGYLIRMKELVRRIEPAWISDHLCWGRLPGNRYGHDLWPLPMTEAALDLVSERLDCVQEFIGRPLLIENVSTYIAWQHEDMTEWEFFSELVRRVGCGLLLDVNNVAVSAFNQDFDPLEFIRGIPAHAVGQIHLAGHQNHGSHLFDAHDRAIADSVWNLLRETFRRCGPRPTLIERDENIPEWEALREESRRAAALEREVCRESPTSRTG